MKSNGNGHSHDDPFGQGGFDDFNAPPSFDDEPPVGNDEPPPKTWTFDYVPTRGWWSERSVPPRDNLMGEWLATTSRILLAGPTGVGKTNFILALAMALAAGQHFLHWKAARACRVLWIDGEMPRRLVKRWLDDAFRRAGSPLLADDNLIVLSREDYPDMPPLNTPEGQAFIDQFLEHIGPVNFIFFDNIQALMVGDMLKPEQWAGVLDWQRELTAGNIGQLWIHHTNEEGKIYGDKSRDWQMEATIILEKLDPAPDGIGFDFRFAKHRERTPENRRDFQPARITLEGDTWTSDIGGEAVRHKKPASLESILLAAFDEAAEKGGEVLHNHPNILPGTVCVRRQLVLDYFAMRYAGADEKTINNRFSEGLKRVQFANILGFSKPYAYRIQR